MMELYLYVCECLDILSRCYWNLKARLEFTGEVEFDVFEILLGHLEYIT